MHLSHFPFSFRVLTRHGIRMSSYSSYIYLQISNIILHHYLIERENIFLVVDITAIYFIARQFVSIPFIPCEDILQL